MKSKLVVLEVMEHKGETKEDETSVDTREIVRMELSILDCPFCDEPLRAPIFQCGVGHVLCSTCNVMLNECPQCSGTVFQRCFVMERVVESVVAPCPFSKHGCTEITHFNKKKHEVCLHRPCFCPDSGCSFTATTVPLLVHFTTHHKWPSKEFEYYKSFKLLVKPGPCLLDAPDDQLFLMHEHRAIGAPGTCHLPCLHPA